MLRRGWQVWQRFGRWMGNWIARLALTLFYFTVFVPFGLGTRYLMDPLGIKRRPARFWQPRETSVETLTLARKQA